MSQEFVCLKQQIMKFIHTYLLFYKKYQYMKNEEVKTIEL